MNYKTRQLHGVTVAVFSLLAATAPQRAVAAEHRPIDEFYAYAEAGLGYDSNVLRVDDEVSLFADRSSDSFWAVETGLDSQLSRGNQKFGLHGLVYHNEYTDLNEVDFTGGDASLTWDWAVGTLWAGSLEYEFRRELRDFANQFVPRVDTKSTNLFLGSVERRLTDRIGLGARGEFADIGFSQSERLDLRRTGAGVSLVFDSPAGNTLSLDADYTKRDADGTGGVDNTEFLVGPAVDWHVTDKSQVQAALHYTRRDEEDPALRDYSGLTGRITGKWKSGADNQIKVAAWREVSSFGDEIANFALVTGISVGPTFAIGNRVSASAEVGYETRDFKGEPDPLALPGLDLPERDDDVLTGALNIGWNIAGHIDLLFEYDTQYRSSNRIGRDYDYHRVQLGVRVSL